MSWALIALVVVPLVAVAVSLLDGWRLARAATAVGGTGRRSAWRSRSRSRSRTAARCTTAHGWLRLDSLGAVFLLATGLLYAVAGVYSIGYLHADEQTERLRRASPGATSRC